MTLTLANAAITLIRMAMGIVIYPFLRLLDDEQVRRTLESASHLNHESFI